MPTDAELAETYERLNSDPGNFAVGKDVIYDGEADAWGVPARTTIDIADDDEPTDDELAELDAPLPPDLARELGLEASGSALANHDAVREEAAGIILICHGEEGDTVLFVRHAERGTWEFPGGHLEAGESAEEAARREMHEEIGKTPNGKMSLLMRDRMTGVDYSTFVAHINHTMVPELSGELDDYRWAPPSQPPLPLHPGARLVLDRLGMNEHDIARAIADGRMSSPQRYENVWLFAIRISGTGKSVRPDLKEHVWRDPGLWLAPEMQQRVNGLQVIWEHPPGMQLTWPEFEKRSIGAICLPFVKHDELWGVAKIYDDDAALLMLETQLSTSPAVVFRDPTVNQVRKLVGGEHLLIEGPPDLVDHIAVCELGVWDKGGSPTGVAIGDPQMAEPDQGGAGNEPTLKGIMDALSGINKRIDGIEGTHREEADARKKGDARRRADAFKFSGRKDDDDDDKVRARRDAEEKELEEHEREAGEAEGDARKKAADRRKKADDDDRKAADDKRRGDARMKVDAFKFSGRKDDDDDDKHRGRRDAEEGELEKHLTEAGETAADAKKHAKDARKKADEDEEGDGTGARGDSALATRIAELEASERRRGLMTDADRDALAAAQQSWDEVAMAFGQRASRPLDGEPVSLFERRHARRFQQYSKKWNGIDFDKASPDMLAIIIPEVRADAMAAAQRNDGGDIDNLVLREVKRKDRGGREISEFYGPVRATLLPFRLPSMRARFTDKGQIGRV